MGPYDVLKMKTLPSLGLNSYKYIPDRQQCEHFRKSQKVLYHSNQLSSVHAPQYDSFVGALNDRQSFQPS